METRRFGRSGLTVAAAGVHASWRERDAGDGRRTLTTAMELGVDVVLVDPAFDRAIEAIVGEVVRDLRLRDRAVVATRVPTAGAPDRSMHPRWIQHHVEASLRRTRLEVLPLAILDWDDRCFYDKTWPDTRAGLERLIREGKVQRFGLAPRDGLALDEARLGVSESIFDAAVMPYHLLARASVDAFLDTAKRHDAAVIATQPLSRGLLGGAWTRDTTFAPGDARTDAWPPARITEALTKVAKLAPLARKETDSLAELALRFALQRPEISVVAPSIRTRAHLDELVRAADGRRLGDSLLQRIDEALDLVA